MESVSETGNSSVFEFVKEKVLQILSREKSQSLKPKNCYTTYLVKISIFVLISLIFNAHLSNDNYQWSKRVYGVKYKLSRIFTKGP